jgi:hypothetical protein
VLLRDNRRLVRPRGGSTPAEIEAQVPEQEQTRGTVAGNDHVHHPCPYVNRLAGLVMYVLAW